MWTVKKDLRFEKMGSSEGTCHCKKWGYSITRINRIEVKTKESEKGCFMSHFGTGMKLILMVILIGLAAGCHKENGSPSGEAAQPAGPTWVSLFNGKDLDGWTPKITGFALGDNYNDTFRVEDGVLKVAYDRYEKFDGRFGHLFYKTPFSHYRIRLEYRFTGEQAPEGPGWALRNSGIMLHCQDPATMAVGQNFPVCLEAQLLGGDGEHERSTGNLCTPGTHVVMDGKLVTQHCIPSSSPTYHGDPWVTAEMEVHGGSLIRHIINGQPVIEYSQPQLDPKDADAKKLIEAGADLMVTEGYISLQAESHPVEFRKIELMVLDP